MTTNRIEKEVRRRVYGVYGLTDWEVLLPAGRATVRVRFSGGSLSAMGQIPATFATASETVQALIQRSEHFKNGKIVMLQ